MMGPPGIFLVETKAWEGVYIGFNDRWKRKEGDKWVLCKSPTQQNKYHKIAFTKWLKGLNLDVKMIPEDAIIPVVMMTKCKWLKTKDCSMPIFKSGLELSLYMRTMMKKGERLTCEQIEAGPQAIEEAEPVAMKYKVEEIEVKKIKERKECIRVKGRREKEEQIRQLYVYIGEMVSEVYKDKLAEGWWYFTKLLKI
ncbi:NERD domain-containing protein [Caldanaerovirga acetigignens]|uniref:NERD domain-containing protein n=1 Tax=Caldanaerovirga acetigignens TaxID=447595 RepID=UPI0011604A5E